MRGSIIGRVGWQVKVAPAGDSRGPDGEEEELAEAVLGAPGMGGDGLDNLVRGSWQMIVAAAGLRHSRGPL